MGRTKKWESKSDRVQATNLRKEINPNTQKPFTDYQIMLKFGYFEPGGFLNPISDNAKDNANDQTVSAKEPSTSTLDDGVELTTDDMIKEAKRMHEIEDSVASFKVLVDIWRVKQNVIDETGFYETIDLIGLINEGISKHNTGKPDQVTVGNGKSEKAGNELDKATVSDQ